MVDAAVRNAVAWIAVLLAGGCHFQIPEARAPEVLVLDRAPPRVGAHVHPEAEHARQPRCDDRGNCMIERSTFAWVDGDQEPRTGAIIDVHLACRRARGR